MNGAILPMILYFELCAARLVDFGWADVVAQQEPQRLAPLWKVTTPLPLQRVAPQKRVDRPAQLPRVPAPPHPHPTQNQQSTTGGSLVTDLRMTF